MKALVLEKQSPIEEKPLALIDLPAPATRCSNPHRRNHRGIFVGPGQRSLAFDEALENPRGRPENLRLKNFGP